MPSARLQMIEDLMRRFADLPPEVFFKEELLRHGLSLGPLSAPDGSYQKKSYFIFSFDRTPIGEMQQQENRRAPEEIALVGGPYDLRRTIVSVRINPSSPYTLETDDGRAVLRLEGETISQVEFAPEPEHYRRTLRNGKPVSEIAPTIEWGYLVYLTVFRRCQYVGSDQECRFCDINSNFDQQRAAGLPYTTV
ncbi:MAG: radical SAM protein, partial [Terriglobia bacterium]